MTDYQPQFCDSCGKQIVGPYCLRCTDVPDSEFWYGVKIVAVISIAIALAACVAYWFWPDLEFWNAWRRFFGLAPRLWPT